jgi:hypothetical protein
MSKRDGTTALSHEQLRLIPSVPESYLHAEDLAKLPAATPPPPWEPLIDAVVWVQRPVPEAAAALPASLRRRRVLGLGVAGFVAYRESLVGAYGEFGAAPALVRGGLLRSHVPFLAVDDLSSLHAGRAHWCLPKTLATFSGSPGSSETLEARGRDWWVRARVRAIGPRVPLWLRMSLAQVWPDGSVRIITPTFRGRARLARVDVGVAEKTSFAAWLRPGRHFAVILTDTRMHLPAPRAAHL